MKKVADYYNTLAEQYDSVFQSGMREGEERLLEEKVIGTCVLDIGCGTGGHIKKLREEGFEVFGLDISSALAAISKENTGAPHVVADAQYLPFKKGSFDCVISIFGALNHVRSLPKAVGEVWACLKPGGRFISTLANRWSLIWYLSLIRKGRVRQALKATKKRSGCLRRWIDGREISLWTRFYSAGEVKAVMERHFRIETSSGLSRTSLRLPAAISEYLVFVADKGLH